MQGLHALSRKRDAVPNSRCDVVRHASWFSVAFCSPA